MPSGRTNRDPRPAGTADGARYAIDSQFEAFGGLTGRTIFDNNFAVDGGVRNQFSETVAFQARLEVGEDTYFGIGVRYTF